MAKTPQKKALKTLRKLERQIRKVAEVPARYELLYHAICMRKIIWKNRQETALAAIVALQGRYQ